MIQPTDIGKHISTPHQQQPPVGSNDPGPSSTKDNYSEKTLPGVLTKHMVNLKRDFLSMPLFNQNLAKNFKHLSLPKSCSLGENTTGTLGSTPGRAIVDGLEQSHLGETAEFENSKPFITFENTKANGNTKLSIQTGKKTPKTFQNFHRFATAPYITNITKPSVSLFRNFSDKPNKKQKVATCNSVNSFATSTKDSFISMIDRFQSSTRLNDFETQTTDKKEMSNSNLSSCPDLLKLSSVASPSPTAACISAESLAPASASKIITSSQDFKNNKKDCGFNGLEGVDTLKEKLSSMLSSTPILNANDNPGMRGQKSTTVNNSDTNEISQNIIIDESFLRSCFSNSVKISNSSDILFPNIPTSSNIQSIDSSINMTNDQIDHSQQQALNTSKAQPHDTSSSQDNNIVPFQSNIEKKGSILSKYKITVEVLPYMETNESRSILQLKTIIVSLDTYTCKFWETLTLANIYLNEHISKLQIRFRQVEKIERQLMQKEKELICLVDDSEKAHARLKNGQENIMRFITIARASKLKTTNSGIFHEIRKGLKSFYDFKPGFMICDHLEKLYYYKLHRYYAIQTVKIMLAAYLKQLKIKYDEMEAVLSDMKDEFVDLDKCLQGFSSFITSSHKNLQQFANEDYFDESNNNNHIASAQLMHHLVEKNEKATARLEALKSEIKKQLSVEKGKALIFCKADEWITDGKSVQEKENFKEEAGKCTTLVEGDFECSLKATEQYFSQMYSGETEALRQKENASGIIFRQLADVSEALIQRHANRNIKQKEINKTNKSLRHVLEFIRNIESNKTKQNSKKGESANQEKDYVAAILLFFTSVSNVVAQMKDNRSISNSSTSKNDGYDISTILDRVSVCCRDDPSAIKDIVEMIRLICEKE